MHDPLKTLATLINHALTTHPSLAPFVETASKLRQGKGYSTNLSEEVTNALMIIPNPKLIIDVGANVGDYTAELRLRSETTEVHAFEPSSFNVAMLNERFQNDKKVTVIDSALSNKHDHCQLYSNQQGAVGGSLVRRRLDHFGIDFSVSETVRTIKFYDYWVNILNRRQIDFVKLDIEGLEYSALLGFEDAIADTLALQFEFGGTHIDSRVFFQDYWYFFTHRGFDLHRICPQPQRLLKISSYTESLECFEHQNFIAINRNKIREQ
jgi:FkbM family methyltransferase